MNIDVLKVLIPSILTFCVGIVITPFFTKYFYKYKMWKKNPRTANTNPEATSEEFNKHHNTESEISTPRVGGIIIWVSVIITIFLIYLISIIFPGDITTKLNFLSRNQTLIPLGTLILAALIGLVDDMLQIGGKVSYAQDGLAYRKVKIISVILIGLAISLWFYIKLEATAIHIPFMGELELGIWFIPFFITVMLAVFSTSVVDGMDGLAGGIMSTIFIAYSVIAYFNNQIDLAVFCAVVGGATLAFLWFNIPPARFYMGETGILSLTITLSVIAFLTNSVLFLPIIAVPLVATTLSVIIQIVGYKYFNKYRVFRIAPLHHHFEALGWSREKIVMRYWVIGVVCAMLGTILAMVG
ncbi:MAG: phospho-N-acetylmuramoyl-pentapeptide-transferase [Minisyncoccota bacterium]